MHNNESYCKSHGIHGMISLGSILVLWNKHAHATTHISHTLMYQIMVNLGSSATIKEARIYLAI